MRWSALKAQIFKYWNRLHASFWFIPLLMIIVAIALALTMLAVDGNLGTGALSGWNWTFQSEAGPATALMETIASSMITTASVVFSIMLVALSLASSQFGSRLISSYMRDSRTQISLGSFVSTYIYCLLIIRAIRSSDTANGSFIPELSVALGVGLAIANMIVLIYFIHHISVSIQASEILAKIGADLNKRITHLFPEQSESESGSAQTKQPAAGNKSDQGLPSSFQDEAAPVAAASDGYLQTVDTEALIDVAKAKGLIIRLEHRPGDYIIKGMPLVMVAPEKLIDEKLTAHINFLCTTDVQRTPGQDILFVVNQLVEVAVRALSPGINDPFTAITAIDHLSSAFCRLLKCDIPSPCLYDDQGVLRVFVPSVTFKLVLDAALNPIRQFSQNSIPVTLRALETLVVVAEVATRAEDCLALRRHADMLVRGARKSVQEAEDRRTLEETYWRACEMLDRRQLLEN
jgi:uncharacterized membrane protein